MSESECLQLKSCGLTWKDAVGWMLTLACLQRSPWLPLRVHTGLSADADWPFCLRNAFRVPEGEREREAGREGRREGEIERKGV